MKQTAGQDVRCTLDSQLRIERLICRFPVQRDAFGRVVREVRAVDDVSLEIGRGEAFGLVGQSGCGKTTLAKSVAALVRPTTGRVLLDGVDVLATRGRARRRLRSRIGMVFQSPHTSLNPRMTIGRILAEPPAIHRRIAGSQLPDRVAAVLAKVGLDATLARRFPHELSAGQKQRVAIARAIVLEPELIVCDEPVSSLDVSVRAQILNLLQDLQDEFKPAVLFVSHDLSVVQYFCDRVAVMLAGRIVEQAPARRLCENPIHPYTRRLVAAVPRIGVRRSTGAAQSAGKPLDSPLPTAGCPFQGHCAYRSSQCLVERPPLECGGTSDHLIACWDRSQSTRRLRGHVG